MKHDVKAPSVGESITEVSILKWAKKNGEAVRPGEVLLEIESDKATVEVVAEASGALSILKQEGERIPIGEVIGVIDDSVQGTVSSSQTAAPTKAAVVPPPAPVAASPGSSPQPGPGARKHLAESGLDASRISGTGKDGRITKGDVLQAAASPRPATPTSVAPATTSTAPTTPKYQERPGDRRVAMSMLRAKIAANLVHAQHTAAILTTFNEVDMGKVMDLRKKNKDKVQAKHGVPLGFMSFFTRACVEALKLVPEVNAMIDGNDVIYRDYCDVGIAVGTDRGLVVPVVRGAEKLGFVEIEKSIAALAEKARTGKLSLADMTGGTFTITNGGVYGSLMSTPILNYPQAGILGMHKIQDRPMAVNGKIEIRPMMYLALSYDHRLIDGKGAVTFLVHVKDFLENPEKLGLEFLNGLS